MAENVGDLFATIGLKSDAFVKGMEDVFKTLAAATAAMGAAGAYAVKLASDYNETSNVMQQAFGKGAKAAEQWAAAQGTAMGRSTQQMREYVSVMQASMVPTLGSAQAATQMSKGITQLAVDMGSFFNVADPEAFNALRSALNGEAEPMKRFGVVMSEAALQAYALRQGIRTKVEAMDEAQKATLRYNFILDRTKAVQGDAIRTSDGLANQMKALQANVANLTTRFGQELYPAVTSAVQRITSMVESVANADASAMKMAATIATVTIAVTASGTAVAGLGLAIPQVVDGFKNFIALAPAMWAVGAPIIATTAAVIGLALAFGAVNKAVTDLTGKGVFGNAAEFAKQKNTENINAQIKALEQRIADLRDIGAGFAPGGRMANAGAYSANQSAVAEARLAINELKNELRGVAAPTADSTVWDMIKTGLGESLKGLGLEIEDFTAKAKASGDKLANLAMPAAKETIFARENLDSMRVASAAAFANQVDVDRLTTLKKETDAAVAHAMAGQRMYDDILARTEYMRTETDAMKKAKEAHDGYNKAINETILTLMAGGPSALGRENVARGIVGAAGTYEQFSMDQGQKVFGAALNTGIADAMKNIASVGAESLTAGLSGLSNVAGYAADMLQTWAGWAQQALGALKDAVSSGISSTLGSVFGGDRLLGPMSDGMRQMFSTVSAVVTPAVLAVVVPMALEIVWGAMASIVTLNPAFVGLSFVVSAAIAPFAALSIGVMGITAGLAVLVPRLVQFATQTESFKRFTEIMDVGAKAFIGALEPVFANLLPLAVVFAVTSQALAPLIMNFAQIDVVARVLFEVLRGVGIAVTNVSIALLELQFYTFQLVNGFIKAYNFVNDIFQGRDIATMDTAGVRNDIENAERNRQMLLDMTYDSGMRLAHVFGSVAEAAQMTAESLTNVPAGYKVARERYEAQDARGGPGAPPMPGGRGGGNVLNIFVERLEAANAADLLQQIDELLARRGYERGTTPFMGATAWVNRG